MMQTKRLPNIGGGSDRAKIVPMQLVRKYNVIITLSFLVLLATWATKGLFLDSGNLLNVGERASIVGIVALGQMFVILTGGIDLSVGGIMALSFIVISRAPDAGVPVAVAIVLTLCTGTLAGLINGLIVSKTKVAPFMVTMGTMLFFSSLALYLTGSNQLYYDKLQKLFNEGLQLGILGSRLLPTVTWLIASVAVIFILQKTRYGKNLYAVGGKELAAKLSGINTVKTKICVYASSGLLSSMAAIVLAYRLSASNPDAGMSLQLESIAAVIVGGANINGGEGSVYGTLLGAIIMAGLVNLLNLINADPFIQDAIKGLMLIAFVFLIGVVTHRK